MKKLNGKKNHYGILTPAVSETRYFQTAKEFNVAVGRDFIEYANRSTEKGQKFMVGLSHGQSPAGGYQYILDHYTQLIHPENIIYTFVNSPMARQRNLEGVMDASHFIKKLFRNGLITRAQVIGYKFSRSSLEAYAADFNRVVSKSLKEQHKEGFDYVFLACDPTGRVAAIERNSTAFESTDIAAVVTNRDEPELTGTPYFLLRSRRIAFLATKADKRRPLAWLYASDVTTHQSPGFLRLLPEVNKRMTVFIDDKALTWPQIEVKRKTRYGTSIIRVDTAYPYNENSRKKLPVVLLVHGFLGLNSFDGLLTDIPSHKYIAAAMHYGTIPDSLPPEEYSNHLTHNIEAVVEYFGSRGHPVYIYDHSIGNIYMLMIDRRLDEYPGIRRYLRGRIGGNPFFGEETRHGILGLMDNVIVPALEHFKGLAAKTLILTMRNLIPLDSKTGVRKRAIQLSQWLIRRDSSIRDRIWQASKERIMYLMSNMDSLPHLNRIPIERALNRLPAKVFVLQTHSALEESKWFDEQEGLLNFPEQNIPVLILKSERDGVARFVPRIYQGGNVEVMDVTNPFEDNLFREHLFHMIYPRRTAQIIDDFITKTEREERIIFNSECGVEN